MANVQSENHLDDHSNVLPCSDKLVFDNKIDAEAMSATTRWRYGTELYAYQCDHCQLWHLASHA